MSWYRRIASWILLAAYLPLVVVSSVHVHHETVDADDGCLQCTGHLEAQHQHDCDCLYCHFLSLSYLGRDDEQSTVILPVTDHRPTELTETAELFRYGVSLLRAPPIV
ncbi:MAG: hypothetical protein J6W88_03965 [Bacteroidales bacterium]|nr:hypothetical protein [Bacteroidales bacterium]